MSRSISPAWTACRDAGNDEPVSIAAQNSQILELEELPPILPDTATATLGARIRARFAELHDERERLQVKLKTLAKTVPGLPLRLKDRLFQVFDIAVLWNKPGSQATVRAEIIETTL